MRTFEVKRYDREKGIGNNTLKIKGNDLNDAVKSYFAEILDVASYNHVPFRFPMTVTPSFVVTMPEGSKRFKGDGNGGTREYTAEEYEEGRGYVQLELEWMLVTHTNRPPVPQRYTVTVLAKESDLVSTEPFVVLGN